MVSIVIPTLNEKRYIGALLESLFAQDITEEVEVVIADAGSTDGTLDVIRSYQARHPRLRVVAGGLPPIARNRGGEASAGDPIFFIDADMTMPQQSLLREALRYFRERRLGVATVYLRPDSSYWFDHAMVACYNVWLPISKLIRPSGSMCIVVSRDVFQKTGGYPEDEVMCEDHNFVYNSSKFGRFGIIPQYLTFSVRRFNKEGRLMLIVKYLISAVYLVLFRHIRKPIFNYEFGNYTDDHDKPRQRRG